MSKNRRLTREQDETRLRGLRILARMIVRAHLDGAGEGGRESGVGHHGEGPERQVQGKDGEHVR